MSDENSRPNENSSEPDDSEAETVAPEIEDAAPMDEKPSPINRSARRQNRTVMIAMGIIGIGLMLVLYRGFASDNPPESRVSRPPNVQSTPGGEQQARSQRYQNTLDAANEAGAERARQVGDSFIATPDQPLRSVDEIGQRPEPRVVARPVAPPNAFEPVRRPADIQTPDRRPQRDFRHINELAAAMSAQQQGLLEAWSPRPSRGTVVIEQQLYVDPAEIAEANAAAASAPSGVSVPRTPYVTAGQSVIARVVNASDSDTPGPVVAEIIDGPLNGARVIGQFGTNKNQDALVIQFEQVVLPDGRTISTSAYAVDAQASSIAVKTEIERRYLQRYGIRLAAAFVGGMSEALSQPEETFVGIGDGLGAVIRDQPTLTEGLFAGAANVGNTLATDLERSAPDGPLVKMRAGQMIGILFLENVADDARR
jgi:intracellular multiplication protein IcmE